MNTLTKGALAAALATALATPAYAFDLGGLTESANKAVDQAQQQVNDAASDSQAAIDQATDKADKAAGAWSTAGETANLVKNLSGQLGVSTQQAAGGTAALFALAQSQLSGSQFGGITNKVSGLTSLLGGGSEGGGGLTGTLLNGISSLGGVKTAFSSLGMSPEMIGQFVPIITQFLGTQGVTGSVLGALQSLWTPGA